VPAEPARRGLPWALALAVLTIQWLAALNPELTPLDHEELYNAGHARMIQLGHLKAALLLQYRSYCGGCTINALAGAGIFTVLGPSLWAWKLVPALYSTVAVLFGSGALQRRVGTLAAVVFAGLFILPPPTWQYLSLVAWGNHMEAGCISVVAIVLLTRLLESPSTGRALALGSVIGLGMWIGFSSGFIALAVAGTLALNRAWRWLGLVVVSALPVVAIWCLQAATTDLSILDTIYYPGERLPDPTRIPGKIWSLIAPRQLVALFGHPASYLGWMAGWAWALVAAWAWLRAGRSGQLARAVGGATVSFVLVYALVRFTVWAPPAPEIAPPGSMRYAAPLFPLLFLLIAAAVGEAWKAGRRRVTVLALVPLLAVGLSARSTAFSDPFPSSAVTDTLAADFPYFRNQASYRLSPEAHAACETTDQRARSVHAYGLGWHAAQAAIGEQEDGPLPVLRPPPQHQEGPFFEAVGGAVLASLDPTDSSGVEVLEQALYRLSAQAPSGQRAALGEIAWRRSEVWLGKLRDGHSLNQATLRAINHVSQGLEHPADEALRTALGRRWAEDLARWGQPKPLYIPAAPAPGPGFLEGVAFGLGVKWGPGVDLDPWWPASTPPSGRARRAHQAGARRRWIVE
jgi:hypothetical protein